jgi:hypothetical protein
MIKDFDKHLIFVLIPHLSTKNPDVNKQKAIHPVLLPPKAAKHYLAACFRLTHLKTKT